MPSCINCAPTVTPLSIEVESPLAKSGSGTPQDPLKLKLAGRSSSLVLAVRDTDTVNLTLYGTGSEDDPYTLSADTGSAFKLTDLSDVRSDAPIAGQVPTWVGPTIGGHWEFKSPIVADTDSIDAAALTGTIDRARLPSGLMLPSATDVTTQDWNSILGTGIYRVSNSPISNGPVTSKATAVYGYGTLVVFSSGASVTQTYYEHGPNANFGNLWWRTKWNAADWTAWATASRNDRVLVLTGSAAMAPVSGYPMTNAILTRDGNTVTFNGTVTAPNGLSNAGALNGNISSIIIGTIPPEHCPAGANLGHVATTGQGLALNGYVDPSGAVRISTMPSGTIAGDGAIVTGKNYPIQVGGTWVAKELYA